MRAEELVKDLIADGVTFETDGERIRWKSEKGPLPAEVISTLSAAKRDVIAFLIRARQPAKTVVGFPQPRGRAAKGPLPPRHPNPVRHLMDLLEGDLETYADALRRHGPMTYGMAMDALGWGATRAGKAEQALRRAGRITFDSQGRAVLVEDGGGNGDQ